MFALHLREPGERLLDFTEHGFERILLDTGIVTERREGLTLALELFHQIRLQVGTTRYFGNFEQRGQRNVVLACVVLIQEEREALEQIFEAQQRANSLVERILVKDQARSPLASWVMELQDILMPPIPPGNRGIMHFLRRIGRGRR